MTAETDAAGMSDAYLEQMRAHIDEGGQLMHRNAVDLLKALQSHIEISRQMRDESHQAIAKLRYECAEYKRQRDEAARRLQGEGDDDEMRREELGELNGIIADNSDNLAIQTAHKIQVAGYRKAPRLLAQPDARKAALEEAAKECERLTYTTPHDEGDKRVNLAVGILAKRLRRLSQQRPERE